MLTRKTAKLRMQHPGATPPLPKKLAIGTAESYAQRAGTEVATRVTKNHARSTAMARPTICKFLHHGW
eukprot:525474-Amphidinium_carterae.1